MPDKYVEEIIKTDLSGNEISGEGLKIKAARNDEEAIYNNGKSRIKFEQIDLAPNAVNTYVIEELETIAPHVNSLKDKKLIAKAADGTPCDFILVDGVYEVYDLKALEQIEYDRYYPVRGYYKRIK